MKRRFMLGTFVAALVAAAPASAITRDEVAKKHAPIFYQEVRDKTRDLYTAYDFDGNWAGDDNEENVACVADAKKCAPSSPCAGGKCGVIGTVYFTVIETSTHWFVQYMPYHPRDTKATNGHEHDTESVLVVVAKDATIPEGKLQAIETRFHTEWFAYADASVKAAAKTPNGSIHVDAQGHPQVYSQQVGHGLCGGFSPPNNVFPDLQLTCNHGEAPPIAGTGVVYRPDIPVAQPVVADGKAVDAGYAMVEIFTSFWARRSEIGPGKTFKDAVDYAGDRCNVLACPKAFGGAFMGDGGESPSGPWNQEGGAGVTAVGSQFFDPAYTMSKRLGFPEPFSLDYCHNPYVGISDKCPSTPPSTGSSGAPSTTPSTPGASTDRPSDPPAAPSTASESGCMMHAPREDGALPILALAAVFAVRRRRRQ
jgi:MYXO-CTERM domain-containing protein